MKRDHIFHPSVFLMLMLLLCVAFGESAIAQTLTLTGRSAAWKPVAGETLKIIAEISDPNNTLSSRSVKFELSNVSSWKGTCMNSDKGDNGDKLESGTKPDLKFVKAKGQSTTVFDAQLTVHTAKWTEGKTGDVSWVKAECQTGAPNNYTVGINVLDYAAYGELTARLLDGSGAEVAGAAISLPLDANGNYIADGWESDATANYNPAVDNETGPTMNGNAGDGLVVFEEYRGFKVNGTHTRTSPTKKDIFIYTEFGAENGATTDYGIGWATNLPGIFVTHRIIESEMEKLKSRIINFNSLGIPGQFGAVDSWRVIDQRALHVNKAGLRSGDNTKSILGIAKPINGSNPTAPANIEVIDIYSEAIAAQVSLLKKTTPLTSEADLYRYVIGHEIGHALSLWHPWQSTHAWLGFQNVPRSDPDVAYNNQNAWDFSVSPAVLNLNTYNATNKTYAYGSSIMDRPLPGQINNQTGKVTHSGIFPSSSYHQFHNSEYELVYPSGSRQTTATHTRRLQAVDSTWSSVMALRCLGGCGDEVTAKAQPTYHLIEDCSGCGKDYYQCTEVFAHAIIHNIVAPENLKCGHLYRLCASGDHGQKQATCATDPNCISTNFWLCQHTTHEYAASPGDGTDPPPASDALVACGNTTCSLGGQAATSTTHQYTCRNFHTYWVCNETQKAYHSQVKTCVRSGCGLTYVECDQTDTAKSGCVSGYAWHTTTAPPVDPPVDPPEDPPEDPPVTLLVCGIHSSGTSGNHSWVSSCTVSNGTSTCTNTSGYYACTPHTHTYKTPPKKYEACGVHTLGTSGNHTSVSCPVNTRGDSCQTDGGTYFACLSASHTHSYPSYHACSVHTTDTTGDHSSRTCPTVNGKSCQENNGRYYACTPHTHRYPKTITYHGCNVHKTSVGGNHSWVSSCAVSGCTNTTGYYACTPHTHTYAPQYEPCGVHLLGSSGDHAWVSCPSNSYGDACSTGGYYTCQAAAHTHSYPGRRPCGHLLTAVGDHTQYTCPSNFRGEACQTSGGKYWSCKPHTHSYPAYHVCNIHKATVLGNHSWVSSCTVSNATRTCTNTTGYYACTPHTHTYNPAFESCNLHSYGSSGNHSWVSSCTVSGCTNTTGYYACSPHTHTYNPTFEPCNLHSYGSSGNHSWVSSCTVSECTNTTGYYACTPHTHTYPSYHPCGIHTTDVTGSHSWVSCPSNGYGDACSIGGYYACQASSHTHSYPGRRACGHLLTAVGNHTRYTCPSNSRGDRCQTSGGQYWSCKSHTHSYPAYHVCNLHKTSVGGSHSWVTCPTNSRGDACQIGGYYACQASSHTHSYPAYHVCNLHKTSVGGNHSWVTCPPDSYGKSCRSNGGGYYACQAHTHDYPITIVYHACRIHTTSVGGSHSWVTCSVNSYGDRCQSNGGGYYACQAASHTHSYPGVRPCGNHSYGSSGNHSYVSCPTNSNGDNCQVNNGGYYVCSPHAHSYPRRRSCGHLQTASGNHSWRTCPTNASGDNCSIGGYYACQSHTHSYPAARPCGHSYSQGGSHSWVWCPTNASGDSCSIGGYYACKASSHTHSYPGRRPCGHLQTASGNHSWRTCPTNASGDNCSIGGYYACKSHTHSYPARRSCGHLYTASGNHSWVWCPTNASGDNCSIGGYYACKSHTHSYPARRSCGHLYTASGNHSWVWCPTNASGDNCSIGGYYACKSHTHSYPARRPCGHLYTTGGSHGWVSSCNRTSNGKRCSNTSGYYACTPHTHTYSSSGNNSSGNNSSGNNSSGNNSSGNNSSGNNSSGNNSSGVLCGRSGCGEFVPTKYYHGTYCGAGHYIWGCHEYTVWIHSTH